MRRVSLCDVPKEQSQLRASPWHTPLMGQLTTLSTGDLLGIVEVLARIGYTSNRTERIGPRDRGGRDKS